MIKITKKKREMAFQETLLLPFQEVNFLPPRNAIDIIFLHRDLFVEKSYHICNHSYKF